MRAYSSETNIRSCSSSQRQLPVWLICSPSISEVWLDRSSFSTRRRWMFSASSSAYSRAVSRDTAACAPSRLTTRECSAVKTSGIRRFSRYSTPTSRACLNIGTHMTAAPEVTR